MDGYYHEMDEVRFAQVGFVRKMETRGGRRRRDAGS
jgi:hypothetical protein